MKNFSRKVGYGLGDMGTAMFWRIFSYFLPFFYSNVVGLNLMDAGIIVLATRIWDAVSDLLIGVIADRTNTKNGKYRPYLLWFAAPFAISGILLFTAPDLSYAGKLLWACFTYVLMMTIYTCINVPYAAMLVVITDNSREKTVYSTFRMFFAYTGSFIAMVFWEPLCTICQSLFGLSAAGGWLLAMVFLSIMCCFFFIISYVMTREVVHPKVSRSVSYDFKSLVKNRPWLILSFAAMLMTLLTTVRGVTAGYFFADVIGVGASMWLFGLSVLFYAGLFLGIGEVMNMVGVMITVPVVDALGKKSTFVWVNVIIAFLSMMFFFVPASPVGMFTMLLIQIVISILTGILSPLIWAMFADVCDYSELEYQTASPGLIFSSGSMAQKIGGAIGGAGVLWLLELFGYVAAGEDVIQDQSAINCMWILMSFIPALIALATAALGYCYPLTTQQMDAIGRRLKEMRTVKKHKPIAISPTDDFEIVKI